MNRFPKFIVHNGAKIIIEENTRRHQLQKHTENQGSLESELYKTREGNRSEDVPRAGRDLFSSVVRECICLTSPIILSVLGLTAGKGDHSFKSICFISLSTFVVMGYTMGSGDYPFRSIWFYSAMILKVLVAVYAFGQEPGNKACLLGQYLSK